MIILRITLINKLGLHARAAAKLVNEAAAFASKIEVSIAGNGQVVDAKSIMSVMMLAASCGTELEFSIDGTDAEAAETAIKTLIDNRFGEPE